MGKVEGGGGNPALRFVSLAVTWYCTAFQLLSTSPLVRMMPFSSTRAFFSMLAFSTRTFKRLRSTMAALPAVQQTRA